MFQIQLDKSGDNGCQQFISRSVGGFTSKIDCADITTLLDKSITSLSVPN